MQSKERQIISFAILSIVFVTLVSNKVKRNKGDFCNFAAYFLKEKGKIDKH